MAAPWRRSTPPKGWEEIEHVVLGLDAESREVLAESHLGKRKVETEWPVYQLNNQRTRYIWDMFSRYKRIDKRLYDWCVKHRLVDALLVAKWKRPGYERLCSTFVINPKNFNYGTTSICRVPKQNLPADGKAVVSNATGCLGCASGPGGFTNIFGNKYGQNLADIQMCRERGKLKEAGLWSESEAAEEWRRRAGGGTGAGKKSKAKRNRLELLALDPNGEVWATQEEEAAMLRAKKGIESEAAADSARAEAVTMAHAASASASASASSSATATAAYGDTGAAGTAPPQASAYPYSHPGHYPAAHAQHYNQQAAAAPQAWTMGAYTTILNHSAEGKAAAAKAAAEAGDEAASKRDRAEESAPTEQTAGANAAPETAVASAEAESAGSTEAKRVKVAEGASAE